MYTGEYPAAELPGSRMTLSLIPQAWRDGRLTCPLQEVWGTRPAGQPLPQWEIRVHDDWSYIKRPTVATAMIGPTRPEAVILVALQPYGEGSDQPIVNHMGPVLRPLHVTAATHAGQRGLRGHTVWAGPDGRLELDQVRAVFVPDGRVVFEGITPVEADELDDLEAALDARADVDQALDYMACSMRRLPDRPVVRHYLEQPVDSER